MSSPQPRDHNIGIFARVASIHRIKRFLNGLNVLRTRSKTPGVNDVIKRQIRRPFADHSDRELMEVFDFLACRRHLQLPR